MGRWKAGPQGAYYDPNDTGPNQVNPPPGASEPQLTTQPVKTPLSQSAQQPIGFDPNAEGAQGPAAPQAPVSTTQPFQREQFRDAWMGTGTDVGAQNALLRQYGIQVSPNGTATLPTGEQIDLRFGARAGINRAQWTGVGSGLKTGQTPSGPAPVVAPLGGGPPAALGGGGGTLGGPGGGADMGGAVRQAILDLMGRNKQPVNADEMNATPEAQAYRRVAERELMRNRAQMAEGAAARGLGQIQGTGEQSGALQSNINQGQEALAERMQAFQSQLVSREMQNRRSSLQQALALGAGVMGRDQEAALRRELAALDAQLRREGMSLQERMQGRDIGSRESMFGQQMGFNYDQAAAEQAYREAMLNQNAFDRLYGG